MPSHIEGLREVEGYLDFSMWKKNVEKENKMWKKKTFLRSFWNEQKNGERRSELGKGFRIFEAEEKKDLFPYKVLTCRILGKLLDEERLLDLGTGKSSS